MSRGRGVWGIVAVKRCRVDAIDVNRRHIAGAVSEVPLPISAVEESRSTMRSYRTRCSAA